MLTLRTCKSALNRFLYLIWQIIISQLPFIIVSLYLLQVFRSIYWYLIGGNYKWSNFFTMISNNSASALVIFVLALLITLTHKRWVKITSYVLVFALSVFSYFLYKVMNIHLSPAVLVLLAETTASESREFMNTFMVSPAAIYVYIRYVILIAFTILIERGYQSKRVANLQKRLGQFYSIAILVIVGGALGIYSIYSYYQGMLKCRNTEHLKFFGEVNPTTNPFREMVYSLYGLYVKKQEQQHFVETMVALDDITSTVSEDTINVVLVIGESYIKQHSQLYGYSLHTSPNLKKQQDVGNLFVFNDVVSPYSQTSKVIKNTLCTNSISDGQQWEETPFFPTLFCRAGYQVYFWDNQKTIEPQKMFSFVLNSFLYCHEVMNITYTLTNDSSYQYDERIVDSFNNLKLQKKRNFIMFHLLGQHIRAAERFPHTPSFLHFTVDSINRHESWMTDEKRQCIADYANATLYNDYVLNKIFEMFKNTNTVLVYYSDHGDEVYDYRDSMGRIGNLELDSKKAQYFHEIPFMIWCSDGYIKRHPGTIEQIRKAQNKPFMTDNLCQLMFHLGGIKTKFYRENRDLLSPKFKPSKRLLNGTIDYDSLMRRQISSTPVK